MRMSIFAPTSGFTLSSMAESIICTSPSPSVSFVSIALLRTAVPICDISDICAKAIDKFAISIVPPPKFYTRERIYLPLSCFVLQACSSVIHLHRQMFVTVSTYCTLVQCRCRSDTRLYSPGTPTVLFYHNTVWFTSGSHNFHFS